MTRIALATAALLLLVPGAAAAATATPAAPPTPATVSAVVHMGAGVVRSCRGVAGACTIERLPGRTLELRTGPGTLLGGRVAVVQLTHRAPGARRLAPAGIRRMVLGGARATAVRPLRLVTHRAGLWCMRVALEQSPDIALRVQPPTCIRHRPPVEIGWAGDIVVGSSYGLPPNGGRDQFDGVDHLLRRPDLMIGNYEGTLARGGSARCGGGGNCYLFQAPPERARNLRAAGFDVMNLANNHALDFGADARRQTVRALERVGVAAAGLPGQVQVVHVQDTRVAIVGLSPYPGMPSLRDPEIVRALVARAERRGDVVVFLVHVGLEGAAGAHVPHGSDYGTNTRAALRQAIDAGADVVFGSGPHVVRGVERYRGRFIVYSSGNFAGWHNFALGGLSSQSGVVRMTFDLAGRPTLAAWDGVVLRGAGVPRVDRSGDVVRRVAALSRADFGRAGARFSRGGSFR